MKSRENALAARSACNVDERIGEVGVAMRTVYRDRKPTYLHQERGPDTDWRQKREGREKEGCAGRAEDPEEDGRNPRGGRRYAGPGV